jgi:hypothetical protein
MMGMRNGDEEHDSPIFKTLELERYWNNDLGVVHVPY